MKYILSTAIALLIGVTCFAQTKVTSEPTQLDTTSVLLLQRISEHTAQSYKLYKTENVWTFLELETFTGRIWQVQYTVDESKASRMKTVLNYVNLVKDGEEYAGRFELYPTQNMYNFILLDTATGRTWQAQWSTSYANRGILEIE